MFAAHNKFDNLIVVVDRNHKIILGDTEDVLKLEPIEEKWSSFGWHVSHANGHCYDSLLKAFARSREVLDKPSVIIAETTKGKGISYMEGRHEWHYLVGNESQIKKARKELSLQDHMLASEQK